LVDIIYKRPHEISVQRLTTRQRVRSLLLDYDQGESGHVALLYQFGAQGVKLCLEPGHKSHNGERRLPHEFQLCQHYKTSKGAEPSDGPTPNA
jgi:hypothetical protein